MSSERKKFNIQFAGSWNEDRWQNEDESLPKKDRTPETGMEREDPVETYQVNNEPDNIDLEKNKDIVIDPSDYIDIDTLNRAAEIKINRKSDDDRKGNNLHLGYLLDKEQAIARMPFRDLTEHVSIFGNTGSGKSVAVKRLIEETAICMALGSDQDDVEDAGCITILDIKGNMLSLALMIDKVSDCPAPLEDRQKVENDFALSQAFGITPSMRDFLRSRLNINIFTPDTTGHRYGPSLIPSPPLEYVDSDREEQKARVTDEVSNKVMAQLIAKNRRQRKDTSSYDVFKHLIYIALQNVWDKIIHDRKDRSKEWNHKQRVTALTELFLNPPDEFKKYGNIGLDKILGPKWKNSLTQFASKLIDYTIDYKKILYNPDICLDDFDTIYNFNRKPGKVNLNIFSMPELKQDTLKHDVSVLVEGINAWYKSGSCRGSAKNPKLLLVIDEANALGELHDIRRMSRCGQAIEYYIRQAREFGCCIILSSQRDTDIDVKLYSNFCLHLEGTGVTPKRVREDLLHNDVDLWEKAQYILGNLNRGIFLAIGNFSTGKTIEKVAIDWLRSMHIIIGNKYIPKLIEWLEHPEQTKHIADTLDEPETEIKKETKTITSQSEAWEIIGLSLQRIVFPKNTTKYIGIGNSEAEISLPFGWREVIEVSWECYGLDRADVPEWLNDDYFALKIPDLNPIEFRNAIFSSDNLGIDSDPDRSVKKINIYDAAIRFDILAPLDAESNMKLIIHKGHCLDPSGVRLCLEKAYSGKYNTFFLKVRDCYFEFEIRQSRDRLRVYDNNYSLVSNS